MQLFNWLYRFRRDHARDGVREFQEMQAALSVSGQPSAPAQAAPAQAEAQSGSETPAQTIDSAAEREQTPPTV